MKIAVNARLLIKNRLEGIGQFTFETLKRITKSHPEHHFFLIFDRKYDESFVFSENVTPVVAFPQARHPYLWYLFFEFGIPFQLRKIKPDLFLSTDGWIPTKLDIPVVNVIHDLNFAHHPEWVPPAVNRYYGRFFPKFAKKATRLVTVSEFSKQDIASQFHIPQDRIDVVYSGSNSLYRPLSADEQFAVKQQFTSGKDFFLFVGLIHQRKNLTNIFKAFDEYKSKRKDGTKLVIVGSKKWWAGEIEDTYNSLVFKDEVVMMGYQPTDVVVRLAASCRAMLYPSLFEGFGLPIVDSFNAGVPVITSNLSAMPEIAGDAAILVDPYDSSSIASAMIVTSSDDELRNGLIQKGIARKHVFTWDRTAELLWETVNKTLPK